MELKAVCASYFNGFQELYNLKYNTLTTNVIALVKAVSYFTVIIPLGFGITYGIASLAGRISYRQELTSEEEIIHNQARERLHLDMNNNNDVQPQHPTATTPIQINESKKVHTFTGDLTPQEKLNIVTDYSDDRTQLAISFAQSPAISVSIRRQDMFESGAEVIVNAANTHLGGGGGIDGAIHSKGGSLYAEAHKRLKTLYASNYIQGHAAMIESGALQSKYQIDHVIVVAGPQGKSNPLKEDELYSCYYNSLLLAASQGIKSIAFSSISTGLFGFPKERAAPVSLKAIYDFIEKHPDTTLTTISIHFLPSEPERELETYEKAAT